MGVSFETYLPRHWDVERHVVTTLPRRLVAGWVGYNCKLFCFTVKKRIVVWLHSLSFKLGYLVLLPKVTIFFFLYESCPSFQQNKQKTPTQLLNMYLNSKVTFSYFLVYFENFSSNCQSVKHLQMVPSPGKY